MVAAVVLVVCGVSGAGKTTIGRLVADAMGYAFLDADDLHPPENVAKMARGVPLTDADRAPWLAALRARVDAAISADAPLVLACSALKARYRAALGIDQRRVVSIFLNGSRALIAARLAARQHAFMPPALLESQFAALEPPADGIHVSIDSSPAAIVSEIVMATRSATGSATAAKIDQATGASFDHDAGVSPVASPPAPGAADAPHCR